MLYDLAAGVNAAPRSGQYDRESDVLGERNSLDALAAVVPHRANVTSSIPEGGGGIGPQGSGGGGGGEVPEGSQSIAVTVPPHSLGFAGRNVSPVTPSVAVERAARGSAILRSMYRPSAQGARVTRGERVSPISRGGAGFPTGGLFGIDADNKDDLGLGFNFGRWVKTRFRKRRKSPAPQARPTYPVADPNSGIVPLDRGLSGLEGGFMGRMKKAFTPPRKVRQIATKVGRVSMATAVGAGAGFITSGGNPVGAIAGGAVGLGKGIKSQVQNRPMGRTLYQTAIMGGAAGGVVLAANAAKPGVAGKSIFAKTTVAPAGNAGFAPASSKLSLMSTSSAKPVFTSAAMPLATPAQIAGGAAPVASASPSLIAASSTAPIMHPATVGISGAAEIATPAQVAAMSSPSVAPVAAASKSGLLVAGGKILSGVAQAALPLVILQQLGRRPDGSPMEVPSGEIGGGSNITVTGGEPVVIPMGGGGGGGESSGEAPIMAGVTLPMALLIGGVIVTGAVMLAKGKR